jgi:hypothetical protein
VTFRRVNQREFRSAVKAQLEGLAVMAGKTPEPYGAHIPKQRVSTGPKPPDPLSERVILKAILKYLRAHPKVACCWRMQSGLFQQDERTIRVGTPGMPDIIGMLKGGRLFAIEVKRIGGKATESQESWLSHIAGFGGRAGVAQCVADAERIIE